MRNLNYSALSAPNSDTVIGSKVDTNQVFSASFHAYFGDTNAVGVVKIQGSNDPCPYGYLAANFTPTNWINVPSASANITSGGSALITIAQSNYRWLRAVWTPTAPSVAASEIIQDLTYTAVDVGVQGNSISLTYMDPGTPNNAIAVGVVGDAITVTLGTSAVYASLILQDITYTAVAPGSVGNSITVTYSDPGAPDSPLSVDVVGTGIIVSLATDFLGSLTSTAQDIYDLLTTTSAVTDLVGLDISGNPLSVQSDTGGGAAPLANGDEPLSSTAADILAAIEASAPASDLVDVVVSGTGSNIQTAQSETFLENGSGGGTTITVNVNAISV